MQKKSYLAILFIAFLLAAGSVSQSIAQEANTNVASLCVLQKTIAEGQHKTVRVAGMYGPGLDQSVLEDSGCPRESTWVELGLRSQNNKKKLHKILDRSRRAYVVLEGELFGPPLPDPKLPQTIQQSYHPGWGHLGAFKTKLIVHKILVAKPGPVKTAGSDGSQ